MRLVAPNFTPTPDRRVHTLLGLEIFAFSSQRAHGTAVCRRRKLNAALGETHPSLEPRLRYLLSVSWLLLLLASYCTWIWDHQLILAMEANHVKITIIMFFFAMLIAQGLDCQ